MQKGQTRETLSFKQWYHQVDLVVQRIVSVGVQDLVDWPSRDYYDSGYTAEDAAKEAILNDSTYAAFFDD